jgi:hypothetical protein
MHAIAPPGAQTQCALISAGCTTGWTDWIHGELWLCPDGLLRRRLGLVATVLHGMRPTVNPDTRPRQSFSSADVATILSANRRNLWLPWSAIEKARLGIVPGAHELRLWLTTGRQARLLWILMDPSEHVAEALSEKLRDRFTRA